MYGQVVANDGAVAVCSGRAIAFDANGAADCVCAPFCPEVIVYRPTYGGPCELQREPLYVCPEAVCSNTPATVGELLPEFICHVDEHGGLWCYERGSTVLRETLDPMAFIVTDSVFCGPCNGGDCPTDPPCPCGCEDVCYWDAQGQPVDGVPDFCCWGARDQNGDPTYDVHHTEEQTEEVTWTDGCRTCAEVSGASGSCVAYRRTYSSVPGSIQYDPFIPCEVAYVDMDGTIFQCATNPGGFYTCDGCGTSSIPTRLGVRVTMAPLVPFDTGWVPLFGPDPDNCGAFARQRTQQVNVGCNNRIYIDETEGLAIQTAVVDGNVCCACTVLIVSRLVRTWQIIPGPDPLGCCGNCRLAVEGSPVGAMQTTGLGGGLAAARQVFRLMRAAGAGALI